MCNSIPKGFTAVWDSFGIFLPSSCLGDNQWQVVLKDFGGGDMDDPLQVHTRPMEELPRTVCKAGFSSLGLQAAVISNRSSVYTVLPLVYLSPVCYEEGGVSLIGPLCYWILTQRLCFQNTLICSATYWLQL